MGVDTGISAPILRLGLNKEPFFAIIAQVIKEFYEKSSHKGWRQAIHCR